MIHQPVDEKYLPKIHLCAKCGQEFEDGDIQVELAVSDYSEEDGGYSTYQRAGCHPIVHFECLAHEDRPVVINHRVRIE